MFKKLGSLFKKLWNAIRKVLAVLLIIIAVILICFFTFGSGLLVIPFLGIALTPTMALLAGILALTCAFVIDADTSSEVVGKVGEALGDAAKAVGSAAGNVVGGAASGLLSSPVMMWGLLAVGAYFLLGSDGGKEDKTKSGRIVSTDRGGKDRELKQATPIQPASSRSRTPQDARSTPKSNPRGNDLSGLLLA